MGETTRNQFAKNTGETKKPPHSRRLQYTRRDSEEAGIPSEKQPFQESARTDSAQTVGAGQSILHLVSIFEQLLSEDRQRVLTFAEALLTTQGSIASRSKVGEQE